MPGKAGKPGDLKDGLSPFAGLPVEIRQVVIVGTGDQFALAQFEVSVPVAKPAVNAAGMVKFPNPAHGLEGFRQRTLIVVGITYKHLSAVRSMTDKCLLN